MNISETFCRSGFKNFRDELATIIEENSDGDVSLERIKDIVNEPQFIKEFSAIIDDFAADASIRASDDEQARNDGYDDGFSDGASEK